MRQFANLQVCHFRFTLTYKTYKNDVYELKGNDKRDRESWVSVLLKAATDATDASDLDNYDEFAGLVYSVLLYFKKSLF